VCAWHEPSPEIVAEVPVTVARTVVPSYTRYPVTVPLLAPHESEIDDAVAPVTDGLPGVPGVPGLGLVPPPHGAPLSVQLAGLPEPAPMNPKLAVPPGGIGPAQVGLVNVYRPPDEVIRASQ
jgi:hypothetical protein